jgi:extracellular matrix protein 14
MKSYNMLKYHTLNDTGNRSLIETERSEQDYDLDVWQVTHSHVDIYSPPPMDLPDILLDRHPHTETTINVTSHTLVPPISRDDWNLTFLENSTFHSVYHPLYEIDEFMHDMASMHPDTLKIVPLGHSGLGREMLGLSISRPKHKDNPNILKRKKKGFVIMGAQHAREVRSYC